MSELPIFTSSTAFDLRAGDCLCGMAAIPDRSVDLVVTSPPYNLDIGYSTYRDDSPREAYLEWCYKWCGEIRRILKQDGSFFLNVGASPSRPLLPHELVLKLQPLFTLQNTLHWIKAVTVQPRGRPEISVGHFKPINSKRYLTDCHEYIFHLTLEGNIPLDRLAVGTAYADKSNISRWDHTDGQDRRCRGNNWFIPYPTIQKAPTERPHPATFPPKLAEQCIKLHGVKDGMVMLDPFLGLGSAAQAARDCDVSRFIGFEMDPFYLAEAQKRLGLS